MGADQATEAAGGKRGTVASGIVLAVFLGIALLYSLGYNVKQMRDEAAWVDHSIDVLQNLSLVEQMVLRAESAERGYLVTADAAQLERVDFARKELLTLLDQLERLVADNPEQAQRAQELRPLVEARMTEIDAIVAAGTTDRQAAEALVREADAQQMTARVQDLAGILRRAELQLLAERRDRVDEVTFLLTIGSAVISIFALFSAGFGVLAFQRRKAVAVLQKVNTQLAHDRGVLKDRESELSAILTTVPDAMVIIDRKAAIISFSAAAQKLFGYRPEDIVGKNVSLLMPEPFRSQHDGYLARYLSSGQARIIGIGREVIGLRKDDTTFPMELSVGEAKVHGESEFVGFIRDLTERKERERQLQESQDQLFQVSRLSTLGEMASALAHELNQPLGALTNYLNAAKRTLQNNGVEAVTRVTELMDKAVEQGLRAGAVIRRLREFIAKGETDQTRGSLKALVQESLTLVLLTVKDKGVRIDVRLDPTFDLVIMDKVQIQQVIVNLLRNAIEALDGRDLREITVASEPEGERHIAIEVRDTGPGVAPEMLERLFQPFATTKQEGMGIGLSICRKIAESHGGRLTYHPNPRGGAVFRLTLILATPDQAAA